MIIELNDEEVKTLDNMLGEWYSEFGSDVNKEHVDYKLFSKLCKVIQKEYDRNK